MHNYIAKRYEASRSRSVTAKPFDILATVCSKPFNEIFENTVKHLPCRPSLAKNACRSKQRLCLQSTIAILQSRQ